MARVVVVPAGAGTAERAAGLAVALGAPLVAALPLDAPSDTDGVALCVTPERLELCAMGPRAPGPVSVDLVTGRLGRQRKEPGFRRLPLIRAFGLHKRPEVERPFIVDATAGLARDAALLAFAGCTVLAVERSPVLVALIEDGLARAARDAEVGPLLSGRLEVVCADARGLLVRLEREGRRPDAVYVDPMFPERRKSALVKKDMQLLQRLHGEGAFDDEGARALLWGARAAAAERVVVKRPRGAPALAPGSSFTVEGEGVRYDVYRTAA